MTKNPKDRALEIQNRMQDKFEGICDFIFKHPELGGEEKDSADYLARIMRDEGFRVTMPYGSQTTAFRAEFGSDAGPAIGFLAEYDALPGYGPGNTPGHACGHNWIAAVAAGAAITLSKLPDLPGKIVLIGTPAEETYGGKILMKSEGLFDDLDIVIQAHLEEVTDVMPGALAMDSLLFEFEGKAAHAAQYPHEGINALDAVQLTFAGINALRQHVLPDVRIHGIVTDGGKAANIVPDHAAAMFYVRGKTRETVNSVSERVKNCALGAALMTGSQCSISQPEYPFDDLIVIPTLVKLAEKNMMDAGIKKVYREDAQMPGSTDIGNVSQVCPTLYMEIDLEADKPFCVHDAIAMEYVNSPYAYRKLRQVIQGITGTAIDLMEHPQLVERADTELKKAKEQRGK